MLLALITSTAYTVVHKEFYRDILGRVSDLHGTIAYRTVRAVTGGLHSFLQSILGSDLTLKLIFILYFALFGKTLSDYQ